MDKMSVSSLSTPLSLSPPASAPTAKPAANDSRPNTHGVVAKTPFAHLMSREKAQEKENPALPTQHVDADDAEQKPPSDTALTVATDKAAVPDDLSVAADQGVSAVLALLAAAQASQLQAPATSPSPAAAVTYGAPVAAAIDLLAPIATPPKVDPGATNPPFDIASLSPADQQLLRSMTVAMAKTEAATEATTAAGVQAADETAIKTQMNATIAADIAATATTDSAAVTTIPTATDTAKTKLAATAAAESAAAANPTAPDISKMAAALNQAFGRINAKSPPKASPSSTGALPAIAAATPGAAVSGSAPTLEAIHTKHSAEPREPANALADIVAPAGDAAIPAFAPVTDAASNATSAPTATTGIAQPSHAEQSVTRHLDMLRDTQWLDNLAHDISQAAAQNGQLKFQINPEHLGSLAIEITHGDAGASIRMTTDNDHARAIIADAQPRLLAEVRAQGLRVADAHVDLGNQASGGGSANNRSSSEDHKPFVRTQMGTIEEASDSPPRDDELYA